MFDGFGFQQLEAHARGEQYHLMAVRRDMGVLAHS